jgi:hypothetical protein
MSEVKTLWYDTSYHSKIGEKNMEDAMGLVPWVMDNALLLITAVFIPLLTGLLTRLDAHPALKSAVNFALAFLAALVDQLVSGDGHLNWEVLIVAWLAVAGISHSAYKMVWKPAGNGVSDPVRLATPTLGLGGGYVPPNTP